MRILFLSRWYPYPPDNGSKIRVLNLLRALASKHEVTLVSFAESPVGPDALAKMRGLCKVVQVVRRKPFDPASTRARLGFLASTPRSVLDTYSVEMEQQVRQALDQGCDAVVASQIDMAAYSHLFGSVPAVLEELELGALQQRVAQAPAGWNKLRAEMTWAKHCRYVRRVLRRFAACTVATREEQALLAMVAPEYGPAGVIPNTIDLASLRRPDIGPTHDSLVYAGSFRFAANHDAMVWFVGEILPLIRSRVAGAHLTITGDHAGLPLPSADQITLTGFVDDVHAVVASAAVSVAPIRVGGGSRLKILEAMALGTPVVATSKGAEGLDVRSEEHLLIADSPEAYADSVVRLLQDGELRRRLAANALQLVRERYDWAVVEPRFLAIVEGAAASAPAAGKHVLGHAGARVQNEAEEPARFQRSKGAA